MTVSKVSFNTNTDQTNNKQRNTGELRHDFKHLLQSIRDGNLAEAQKAYDLIAHTLPGVFQTLSRQLTHDYRAIGDALAKGDISLAKLAVVRLQQDLQSIGRTGYQPHFDINSDAAQNSRPGSDRLFDSYNEEVELPTLGSHINIRV